MKAREAVHSGPVWRDRADFIIATRIDPVDTDITTEQLWARKSEGSLFEICCIPFFAYDLALGDIVEVDGDYLVRRVVRPSGRYVFRAHFRTPMLPYRDGVVTALESMGALVEWSSSSLAAVDARDAAHAQQVADFLHDQEDLGRLIYETGKTG